MSVNNIIKYIKSYVGTLRNDIGKIAKVTKHNKKYNDNKHGTIEIDVEPQFIVYAMSHDLDDLLIFSEPKVNEQALKEAIINGESIPYVKVRKGCEYNVQRT